jgi:hypothetical protein
VYPTDAKIVLEEKGYTGIQDIPFFSEAGGKNFNYVRPTFFWGNNSEGEKLFIVAVTPGTDYISHYCEMLQYILSTKGLAATDRIRITRYPSVEEKLCSWTGLDSSFIEPKDKIIIGYVQEMQERLAKSMQHIETHNNEYYTSARYKTETGQVLNFLGVKYSFWGNISAKIARRICELGADELIYVSKVGTLTSADDIYGKLYVPDKYVYVQGLEAVRQIRQENFLKAPREDRGTHVSVPTVLQESFSQRDLISSMDAHSIDNEAAQIACTVAHWNRWLSNKKVSYGSIHFATDYLYKSGESTENQFLNLSSNRTASAREKKAYVMDRIATELAVLLEIDRPREKVLDRYTRQQTREGPDI